MALEDVLRALADHWDDVLARLGAEDRAELVDLIQDLNSGSADADDAALDVTPLLLRSLPKDHAVLQAIRSGIRLSTTLDRPVIPPELRARLVRLALPGPPDPEDIWAGARRRLLQAPSLPPSMLASIGPDADLAALIRLPDDDGTVRIPAFQFDPNGVPRPLVLQINRVLDVLDDPWGVADWWLGENAWLQAAPAGLIGVVDDAVLVATAISTAED
jgi:hypothetical protein